MSNQSDKMKEFYTILAPTSSDTCVSGALLSVNVSTDESVKWIWTHLQNGQSAVTGYQTLKKELTH